jgi:hypothetical protein
MTIYFPLDGAIDLIETTMEDYYFLVEHKSTLQVGK